MFEAEFDGLPPLIRDNLEKQLEDVIRAIARRHASQTRDFAVCPFTKEQIQAMFFAVFDLADKMRTSINSQ